MIRDNGPLSSLGHGVTSRDVPLNEGETEGPSPNSGAISKAINGHPFLRFVASNITAVVAATTASALVRKRLAKTVDDSARLARQSRHLKLFY
jgi:hypothetical protein